MSDTIKKLTELFAKFPTIGHRTAGRFVFYLINSPKHEINELINAMQELKNNVKFCSFCFNPHELQGDSCSICQSASRDRQVLCVVEKESDLISIENTKRYKGFYFVLGGNISQFKKENSHNLRTQELKERIQNPQKFNLFDTHFTEVIVATNPTPEGKTTSVIVERALKELPQYSSLKITHLAKGLPAGGELEYADEETLESAFEGRK